MKSRITTYLLLAAAVVVWGFIALKIFLPKPDVNPPAIREHTENGLPEEEFVLLLNYKDPFLKDATPVRPEKVRMAARIPVKSSPVPQKPARKKEQPPLRYTGTITAAGRISYLVEYDGIQHPLVPGDGLAGYTLGEAFPDSLIISLNGDFYTLPLQY